MVIDVDALANEIRRVDGSHSLGAGALAEALMPFIESALEPKEPVLTAGNFPDSAQGQIAQMVVSLPLPITAPFPDMEKPWTEKEISNFRKALDYYDAPHSANQ